MITLRLRHAFKRASVDSRAWLVLCDALAAEFNALGTLLVPLEKDHSRPWLIASERLLPMVTGYFAGDWSVNDVRERRLQVDQKRGYSLGRDIGSEAELNKKSQYRNLLRTHGIGGFCAIIFKVDGEDWAMSLQFPLGVSDPPAHKLALIPEISHLLEDAAHKCGVHIKKVMENHLESASLGGGGSAVLDSNCRLVRCNKQFRAIWMKLTKNNPDLTFPDPTTRLCIEQFRSPGNNMFHPFPYLLGGGEFTISCHILRIPEDIRIFSKDDIAILTLTEHSPFKEDLIRVLKSSYDLLPSEIQLVLNICEGKKLKAVAQELGITEGTARQRLKAVFRKTDSETQHQLVVNIMKSQALLPRY